MILVKYILKRFFKYLILVNLILVILFNSIDFFEKFIRLTNVSILDIFYTIALGLIPSFFENLAISCWLATALLIKELQQQNEWETFPLLNIHYKKFLNLFLVTGIFLGLFNFLGKEGLANPFMVKSEQFKKEKLKKRSDHKIINKWMYLNNNTFCYFNVLDLKEKIGSDLILINLNTDFSTQKILISPIFKISQKKKQIFISKGIEIYPQTNEQIKIENIHVVLDCFFTQIQILSEQNSLNQILKTLLASKNIIPENSWNELFLLFLKRLLFHLQFILFPLLTLCFFFIPFNLKNYKWILILTPYPLLTLLTAITDFIIQSGFSAWFTTIPYLTLLCIIIFLWLKINSNYYSKSA
ncbi:MAG: LptF/LptG family permease [bacterium]